MKTRRGHTRLSLKIFLVLFAALCIALLVAQILMTSGEIDGTFLTGLRGGVNDYETLLFVWRMSLYCALIAGLMAYIKTKSSDKHPEMKVYPLRMAAYLALFELLIVQNSLHKLVIFISN